MATWQDFTDLFPADFQPVIAELVTAYDEDFSISDYETFAAQSTDTIRTQLVSLDDDHPLLLALATYFLDKSVGVPPEGDGALNAYQLVMLKMPVEEVQGLGKLQNYFDGIDTDFEEFQGMSAATLADAFSPANIATGFWSYIAFGLSTRIAVLADDEFGGFLLSLPLAERTSIESFLKLMVADDAGFDLDALRAMSSKTLAGKLKTLISNPFIRYHWALQVISDVRDLLADNTPDDALEVQFLGSQGSLMFAGLGALQKSFVASELATTVGAIGQLWMDAIVTEMGDWGSGHLFFHGIATSWLAALRNYDRMVAEAALQPITSIAFQIRPTNDDAQPLGGLLVRVMNTAPTPDVELGLRTLDFSGIAYVQYEGPTAETLTLTFEVLSADGETSLVTSSGLAFDPATENSIEVEVAVPALAANTDAISALATELSLTIPGGLGTYLSGHSIATLDDIRRMGGLAKEPDTAITDNLALCTRLDSHAKLELITDDADLREFLIAAEYGSPGKISAKTRAAFVTELTGATYGEVSLAGVYLKAAKVSAVLGHLWIAKGAGHASNYKGESALSPTLEGIFAKQCDCEECRSGVSPLAYLAALLDYGSKYVKISGDPVDVDWFQDHFHQGFCELPADCASVEKHVCQVRIAIEALRLYLGSVDISYGLRKPYLEGTYEFLLNQCGVTWDELRLLHQNPVGLYDDLEASLAERLGVDASKVESFYLDSTGMSPTLTEANLELLFGFQSTLRNPYSDGLLEGSTVINSWQFKGVQWAKNTDADGYLHLEITASPTTIRIYRDVSRGNAYLVGKAAISSATPCTAEIVEQNDSGLFGRIELGAGYTFNSTTDTSITVSVVPRLVAWRLAAQRARWKVQDFPTQNPYFVATRTLPIIEPDLMGPDDMRVPEATGSFVYYGPYDLWANRRGWVDEMLEDFAALGGDMDDLFDAMDDANWSLGYQETGGGTTHTFGPWDSSSIVGFTNWNALMRRLRLDLRSTNMTTRDDAVAVITDDLRLTLESFSRLDELYLAFAVLTPPDFTQEELEDLYNILCQAAKNAYYDIWITEEDNRDIVLSADQFWVPIHGPKEGKWNNPISSSPFYASPIDTPFIDPVEVGLLDLPDPLYGGTHLNTWMSRSAAIVTQTGLIYDARTSGLEGFQEMLVEALGALPDFLDPPAFPFIHIEDVVAALDSLTPDVALEIVHEQLFLTEAEFREAAETMILEEGDPNSVSDAGYAALAKLFVNGWRRKQWGAWFTAEATTDYWKAYKQKLPAWRSSTAQRKQWVDGLALHNRVPIVDPDLIKAGDFVNPEHNANPTLDNAAYEQWRSRSAMLEGTSGWVDTVTSNDFEDNVVDFIGASVDELEDLQVLYEQNKDISARLAQLNLSPQGLGVIAKLKRALDNSVTPSAAELADFHALVVQVIKERQYGAWNIAERAEGISLSPAYFQMAYANYYAFIQYLDAILVPWRSSLAARRDWQDKLESRIAQAQSLIEGNVGMVKATEDRMLITLRDALLRTIGGGGITLDTKGEYLTGKLLLDFKTQCCNETTRVAQAIETLQILFFSIRTGAILDDYPNLTIDNDDWDDDWKWLSTYGTWRSLMFVYMYPENVLMPSLKDRMSGKLRELMDQVRNSSRFTPDMACEVLHDYEDYLKDMANLSLQATVTTTVHVEADGCGTVVGTPRELDFHFALGGHTKTVYMSVVDPTLSADIAQRSWEAIPEYVDCDRIVGATVFQTKEGKRYVYLFALKARMNDHPELMSNRLNLHTLRWDDDLGDLKIDASAQMETSTLVLAERSKETDKIYFVGRSWVGNAIWSAWNNPSSTYDMGSIVGGLLRNRDVLHNWIDVQGTSWGRDDWGALGFLWMRNLELVGAILTEENLLCVLAAVQVKEQDPWYLGYHVFQADSFVSQISLQRVIPAAADMSIPLSAINANDQAAFVQFRDASGRFRKATQAISTVPIRHVGFAKVNGSNKFAWYFSEDGSTQSRYLEIQLSKTWVDVFTGIEYTWAPGSINTVPRLRCLSYGAAVSNFTSLSRRTYIGPCHSFEAPTGAVPNRKSSQLDSPSSGMFTLGGTTLQNLFWVPLNLIVTTSVLPPLNEHPSPTSSHTRRLGIAGLVQANGSNSKANRDYLQEAYYLLPVFVALELQKNKHYEAALEVHRLVYDYTLPTAQRKIWYGLVAEETINTNFANVMNWLDDPENPHTIAGMRANTYTRFTIFSIVRCLLEMADQEFTTDSPESVPRARVLYTAAKELIQDEIYDLETEGCGALLDDLDAKVTDAGWYPEWVRLKAAIAGLNNHDVIDEIVNGFGSYTGGIAAVFDNGSLTWEEKIMEAEAIYQYKLDLVGSAPNRLCTVVSDWTIIGQQEVVLGNDNMGLGVGRMSQSVGDGYLSRLILLTGKTLAELTTEDDLPWLAEPVSDEAGAPLDLSLNQRLNGESGYYEAYYAGNPLSGLVTGGSYKRPYIPYSNHYFCVPQNPVPYNLLLHAELNLFKIRHCRNIAGIHRELDPYGAPTDTTSGMPVIGANGQIAFPGTVTVAATPYRYEVVLSRAKELVQLAAQAESAMLVTLEKLDSERYSLLRARQDLSTAKATVRLQDLRVKESEHEVDAAQMQQERAQFQAETYDAWIEEGLSKYEQIIIRDYYSLADRRAEIAVMNGLHSTLAEMVQFALAPPMVGTLLAGLNAGIAYNSLQSIALETSISVNQIRGSWEQRKREYSFQRSLSEWDVKLAGQQIKIANDRLRITGQERALAQMQADHAEETLEFLRTKFTNADLYDWMSGVLQRVYSFYLQHATSMAKIAQQQLAFERQEAPANLILDDYWSPPSDSANVPGVTATAVPDRRGLTGSARLQMDLTKLDLYSFETEKRKLQLTKTMSLAQLFPAEFEVFRQTGVMNFRTRLEWFDRDFPGHYLRLIKRVRTSVIALVPPGEGIRARLATTGVSRVVVGGDTFQTIITRRGSETVSLTSPIEATGLFEMLPDRGDMLYPFEAMGVDAAWEFRMYKAANPVNFNTIADVLITFEYTALESFDYEQQVIQSLDHRLHGERAFSFKYVLPDQWYDLKNPTQTAHPYVVDFELRQGDFPGLNDLKVEQVSLMFVLKSGVQLTTGLDATLLLKDNTGGIRGGTGTSNTHHGVISTRTAGTSSSLLNLYQSQPGGFNDLQLQIPFGQWTLDLSGTNTAALLNQKDIEDIVLIIGYRGDSPGY